MSVIHVDVDDAQVIVHAAGRDPFALSPKLARALARTLDLHAEQAEIIEEVGDEARVGWRSSRIYEDGSVVRR